MNITSFDVSEIPGVRIGEPVTILSADKNAPNSVESAARICGTVPYEILVHIPASLRRTIKSSI
jgi:alanine racemase